MAGRHREVFEDLLLVSALVAVGRLGVVSAH